MMKLLQQARGMAEMTGRRPQPRPPGPVLWQMRSPRWKATSGKQKRIIRIDMQDVPDIPAEVAIIHLD